MTENRFVFLYKMFHVCIFDPIFVAKTSEYNFGLLSKTKYGRDHSIQIYRSCSLLNTVIKFSPPISITFASLLIFSSWLLIEHLHQQDGDGVLMMNLLKRKKKLKRKSGTGSQQTYC